MIRRVVTEAMKLLPQATGAEAAIVDRLRANNALSLSLVAEDGGEVVGYLAASDARIGDVTGWGPDRSRRRPAVAAWPRDRKRPHD